MKGREGKISSLFLSSTDLIYTGAEGDGKRSAHPASLRNFTHFDARFVPRTREQSQCRCSEAAFLRCCSASQFSAVRGPCSRSPAAARSSGNVSFLSSERRSLKLVLLPRRLHFVILRTRSRARINRLRTTSELIARRLGSA